MPSLQLTSGNICLLDGQTKVTILKPTTRSHSSYVVQISNTEITTVESDRLVLISEIAATPATAMQ